MKYYQNCVFINWEYLNKKRKLQIRKDKNYRCHFVKINLSKNPLCLIIQLSGIITETDDANLQYSARICWHTANILLR